MSLFPPLQVSDTRCLPRVNLDIWLKKYLIYNKNPKDVMILVNKKILGGGLAMLSVGIAISLMLNAAIPLGQSGMTNDEKAELMLKQQENRDMNTLAGILVGVGFLLILISFGARRKRGDTKKMEKKPSI